MGSGEEKWDFICKNLSQLDKAHELTKAYGVGTKTGLPNSIASMTVFFFSTLPRGSHILALDRFQGSFTFSVFKCNSGKVLKNKNPMKHFSLTSHNTEEPSTHIRPNGCQVRACTGIWHQPKRGFGDAHVGSPTCGEPWPPSGGRRCWSSRASSSRCLETTATSPPSSSAFAGSASMDRNTYHSTW